jgi:hypothetical protein
VYVSMAAVVSSEDVDAAVEVELALLARPATAVPSGPAAEFVEAVGAGFTGSFGVYGGRVGVHCLFLYKHYGLNVPRHLAEQCASNLLPRDVVVTVQLQFKIDIHRREQ